MRTAWAWLGLAFLVQGIVLLALLGASLPYLTTSDVIVGSGLMLLTCICTCICIDGWKGRRFTR